MFCICLYINHGCRVDVCRVQKVVQINYMWTETEESCQLRQRLMRQGLKEQGTTLLSYSAANVGPVSSLMTRLQFFQSLKIHVLHLLFRKKTPKNLRFLNL